MQQPDTKLLNKLFSYLEKEGWITKARIMPTGKVEISWTEKGEFCMRALMEQRRLLHAIGRRYPQPEVLKFREAIEYLALIEDKYANGYQPPPDPKAFSSS